MLIQLGFYIHVAPHQHSKGHMATFQLYYKIHIIISNALRVQFKRKRTLITYMSTWKKVPSEVGDHITYVYIKHSRKSKRATKKSYIPLK
jgi:hypothetical protein